MSTFEQDTKRDVYWRQLQMELAELIDPETGELAARFAKHIDCPLCNAAEHQELFKKAGFTFVRCRDCGLAFVNPQPLRETVEGMYENSKSIELWMEVLLSQAEQAWRGDYFASHMDLVEQHLPKGRVLDVGCAIGQFLQVAHQRGWDVMGLELSTVACCYVKEKLGLPVLQKTLAQAGFAPGEFDAATMFGVLEHVPDPRLVLSQAAQTVRRGGVVVVVVPNLYSLLAMTIHERSSTFNGRNHLIYFSLASLGRLFEECGLKVVHRDTLLTGVSNMVRHLQYHDPYGPDQGVDLLPETLRAHFATEDGGSPLERSILDHDLGLRIRVVGLKE